MKLYVFGNGNLNLLDFYNLYHEPISRLSIPTNFIVCDFRGTDTLTMEYLKTITPNVRVFHVGEKPRYMPDKYRTKVSQWELVGGFESDADRDDAAISECTHFLAHDKNSNDERKSGTLRNIERCLKLHKLRIN